MKNDTVSSVYAAYVQIICNF